MTQNEAIKMIKAINYRLYTYEAKGLTESAYYADIIEKAQLYGLQMTTSERGTPRISRSSAQLTKLTVDAAAAQGLTNTWALPSLKEEREKARQQGNKTLQDQYEHIRSYGRLKQWADENLADMYDDYLAQMDEAVKVIDAFKGGLKNMDYSQIFALIDAYEAAKAQRDAVLNQSSFAPNLSDDPDDIVDNMNYEF